MSRGTGSKAACIVAAALGACAASPLFAQAADGERKPLVRSFECRGEEPFWALSAGPSSARYDEAGAQPRIYKGELYRFEFLQPRALVWRGVNGKDTLVAVIREESCASTMADGPPRAWRAILSRPNGIAVTGCCSGK